MSDFFSSKERIDQLQKRAKENVLRNEIPYLMALFRKLVECEMSVHDVAAAFNTLVDQEAKRLRRQLELNHIGLGAVTEVRQ